MPRWAARTDKTHKSIVDALRAVGCSVVSLAGVGKGVPDILAGRNGVTWLIEIKRPAGPKGGTSEKGQRLNEAQEKWRDAWRGGPVHVARTPDEALRAVGAR